MTQKTLQSLWLVMAARLPHVYHPLSGKVGRHTDGDGYTVHVHAYNGHGHNMGGGHHGEIHVAHPKTGEIRRTQYWMDRPEEGWKHGHVNLEEDYNKHALKDQEHKSHWRSKVPLQTRLDMEAHQQATAYKPLKEQFKNRNEPRDVVRPGKHK